MREMMYKQGIFHGPCLCHPDHKIDLAKWSDAYSLGIKIIDDQHMKILSFVDDLLAHEPRNIEDEDAYFKEVVGQVVDYIKVHFATEEGVMQATKYPGYDDHKKIHENFILAVVKNIKDYEAGNRLVLSNFSNFMKKWVLSHIAVVDV